MLEGEPAAPAAGTADASDGVIFILENTPLETAKVGKVRAAASAASGGPGGWVVLAAGRVATARLSSGKTTQHGGRWHGCA